MAKKMTKAEANSIFLLIIVGGPIFLFIKLGEVVGWPVIIASVFVGFFLVVFLKISKTKKRREYLMSKYNDVELVNSLMQQCFWQGQTAEQLIDSLGEPVKIDQKLLKTKKKEVWKYNHQGGNRYALRITLENDEIIGWDQKT